MTTVLVMRSEGLILADSQSKWGQGRISTTEKIVALPDGSLLTGAGNQQACFACFEYIRLKEQAEALGEEAHEVPYVPPAGPDFNPDDFTVLHLKTDRTLWLYGAYFQPTPLLDDVYAIGTGDDIVRTALHLGKSPMEAMVLACELDFNTGPPIVEKRV